MNMSVIQNLGKNNLATDETPIFTDKRKKIQDTKFKIQDSKNSIQYPPYCIRVNPCISVANYLLSNLIKKQKERSKLWVLKLVFGVLHAWLHCY
jgi:hypothetical protein